MKTLDSKVIKGIYGGNCDCKCKPCPNCPRDIYVGAQPNTGLCRDRCQNMWMTFVSCDGDGSHPADLR